MLDTSCAALLRLAQAVHEQGYKVALTGEGADEALAGYVWYKTQKIRDGVYRKVGQVRPAAPPQPGGAARWPAAAWSSPPSRPSAASARRSRTCTR